MTVAGQKDARAGYQRMQPKSSFSHTMVDPGDNLSLVIPFSATC